MATKLGNQYASDEGTYQAKVVYTTTTTNTSVRIQSNYYLHAVTAITPLLVSWGFKFSLSGSTTSSFEEDTYVMTAGSDSLKYTRDKTITRGTSAQTYAVTFSCSNQLIRLNGSSVSFSVTIPALQSYTVSYSASGASNVPSSQTKYYGKTLTLSSQVPTKTGYTFKNWKASDGTTYSAGASYTANKATTLTAQWTANTYTIKYNANGGSGSVANQTKTYGTALTLSNGSGYTWANHTLTGWNTNSDGSGTSYSLGQTLTANSGQNLTLYAQWQVDYIVPTISNFIAYRCDSGGTADDTGEYIHVSFDWTGGTDNGGSSYVNTQIDIEIDSTSAYSGTVSGASGTFSNTYGGSYSINTSHEVNATIYGVGYSTYTATADVAVPSGTFPIDILADGSALGVMITAQSGKSVLVPELFIDLSGYLTTAPDKTIYDALVTLGWDSEVLV